MAATSAPSSRRALRDARRALRRRVTLTVLASVFAVLLYAELVDVAPAALALYRESGASAVIDSRVLQNYVGASTVRSAMLAVFAAAWTSLVLVRTGRVEAA